MGASDAEKGGLLTLTYTSPPEWDCPPPWARGPGGCRPYAVGEQHNIFLGLIS